MFFFFGYFSLMVNTIRIAIAISISIWSHIYIIKKKYIISLSLILLASTFHYTALFNLLVLIFLYSVKKPYFGLFNIFLFLIFLVLFFYFESFIDLFLYFFPKYAGYLNSVYFDQSPSLAVIFYLLFLTLTFIPFFNRKETSNMYNFFNQVFIFNSLLLLLSLKFNLITRISNYFFIVYLLIPSNYFNRFDKLSYNVFMTFYLLVVLFWFFSIIAFRPEWNNLFPYKFYWNN
jgi:hypothetical protein